MNSAARHAACAALLLAAALPAFSTEPGPRRSLARFESEAELREWLEQARKRAQPPPRAKSGVGMADTTVMAQSAPPPAAPAAAAPQQAKAAEESVTNVQTAGVDEGGIVKVHGDHLVILRRGRLFTVGIRGDELASVSMADAFGAGIDPRGAWYDEMLIRGDTVIVIGFSYQRGGTEVGLFDIDREGLLAHRATYHLRSNDYYSSRNYASRLIGDKLIFYTPLYLNLHRDPFASFPAMRKWRAGATAEEFRRIAPATRIYRADDEVEPWGLTLHTVTTCDIARREMECESTGVLGPAGRVFYVSQGSVYVWTTRYAREGGRTSSAVLRIPLERGEPTALKTAGSPVDQLSFLESDDGHLNALLRARGRGEAMWASESTAGSMALLRVPLDSFGDGRDSAPSSAYRRLPSPAGYTLQNRYVGPWLLYGAGSTWGRPNAPQPGQALNAVRWAEPASTVQTISLPHGVDRIEAMAHNAVVIGTAGKDLHFSSVRLDSAAAIPHRYTRPDAAQGETRTHGFFYKPESGETGLIGLPVVAGGRPGHKQLRHGSAAVAFLRNDALMLTELGDLASGTGGNGGAGDDGCKASCVDWYGNARPLFLRGRIFALMGYEIVEGRLSAGRINEVRRASFAPR